jgi:hypothetical protein
MVWGRRDHFCDIRFLSVQMRLAPAATSGARFCGELVGARKDARHSYFRYRWFPVRSRSLPSLGAFGGLVLLRQARQSGTFSGDFCNFLFCGAMAQARWRLWIRPFGIRRFRTRSRGLQSLGAIRPMVFVRRARQNGSNRGFAYRFGALSLQSLHLALAHLMHTF